VEDNDCNVNLDKNGIFAECTGVNKANEDVNDNLVAAIATSIFLRQKLSLKDIGGWRSQCLLQRYLLYSLGLVIIYGLRMRSS